MSYRLKGPQVIIEGDINKIVPQTLPVSPIDGQFIIDSADKKLKVWNQSLNRWIILGDASDQRFDNSSNGLVSNNTQSVIEEVFFREFQTVSANSETSNNSGTVWSNKLTLTTPSDLPLGNYIVFYRFNWRSSTANREADFRIQNNAVNQLNWQPSALRTQTIGQESGSLYFNQISGTNVITLDYKYTGSATTIYIKDAIFTFWRVS